MNTENLRHAGAAVVHTFNLSTREPEADGSLFEASLDYSMNSRTPRATQKNPVLRRKKKEMVTYLLGGTCH